MHILMHAPWPYEYATELASALVKNTSHDTVCLLTRADYPYRAQLASAYDAPYPDPAGYENVATRGLGHGRGVLRVATAIARQRPDVFHIQALHRPALDWPLIGAARAVGARVIWTAHNALPHEPSRLDHRLYARLYRHVDAVIAHTARTESQLIEDLGVPPARIHRIAHGGLARTAHPLPDRAAARARLGFAENDFVLLFFGRIRPYKGLDVLIGALDRLNAGSSAPTVKAVVAGQDQFGDAAPFSVRPDVLTDLRRVDAATSAAYFAAADLVTLPYRAIDQSGVLMLALTYRCAVAATDIGGLGEVITHDETGFLLPGPDPQALAELIDALRTDPARLARVRRNVGIALSGRLDWAELARQTRDVYRSIG